MLSTWQTLNKCLVNISIFVFMMSGLSFLDAGSQSNENFGVAEGRTREDHKSWWGCSGLELLRLREKCLELRALLPLQPLSHCVGMKTRWSGSWQTRPRNFLRKWPINWPPQMWNKASEQCLTSSMSKNWSFFINITGPTTQETVLWRLKKQRMIRKTLSTMKTLYERMRRSPVPLSTTQKRNSFPFPLGNLGLFVNASLKDTRSHFTGPSSCLQIWKSVVCLGLTVIRNLTSSNPLIKLKIYISKVFDEELLELNSINKDLGNTL